MCGKSVTQGVYAHRLEDARFFLGFVDCPLHSTLGIPGVKISAYTAQNLLIFAVEYPFVGLLCFQIHLQSTDKNICQWNIAILFTFTILYMQHFPIKIQISNPEISDLKAAKSTTIKKSDQYSMLEQLGSLEQATDFFLTQNNGKLFAPLDGGQLDPLVLHSLDSVSEAKGIYSKLKVGI